MAFAACPGGGRGELARLWASGVHAGVLRGEEVSKGRVGDHSFTMVHFPTEMDSMWRSSTESSVRTATRRPGAIM